mmetsp:Transcript_32477/g.76423  ORF Transcript_32477/g.76423 Transcript_32477/m.76423 type:complete len:408 (-) Transcript_32477:454-1677(-)|eukprot:CAMPEP_0172399884 /NCGR_PEP_ID=MMETSP1061-20121228/42988_1 /TAXON_ID=37318 /ORGANISM="Pseudo-nitzschia pungens, Strain cf. pungens" /LENGTH=407 /DNA_ID=CAMNT_0013132899 /DNA_START=186 /DNA_END=1409 /DNA_ORIENTATION=-
MNKHTPSFLLLLALVVLVVDASWLSSSSRIPAFCGSVERRSGDKRRLSEFQERSILALRGGEAESKSKSEKTNDEKTEEATVEESEDEDDEDDTTEDEESSEEEESDEEDYYDDETEDEDEDTVLAYQLKKKSRSQEESTQEYVEPYFISPSLQMYSTFGTILLSRKIDMFNPKVVRLIRFLFVLHLVVQQAFIFYVRVMAKRNNDRTPVHVDNPLTSMLSSQLEKQQAGGGGGSDMVKNLASSFLKKESTVAEYDMGKAMSMQGGILFNMALMWLLHFKMQQVQPLLVTTINGLMQLAYNPLFQVYVLGRNLERPFKTPEVFKDPRAQEDEDDEEGSSNSSSTETTPSEETTEENEPETVESVDDDGDEDESESEDESSEDEDEDENDKEEKGDAEEAEDDEEDKE